MDPLNITLAVFWHPPTGPKNFALDCEHDYIVTLSNTENPTDILIQIKSGVYFGHVNY